MVVDAELEPVDERLTVGHRPVVADAQVPQLAAQLGGEHVVGGGHRVGEEGGPAVRKRLLAQEREGTGALPHVGHLVVVVEPRGERRAHLEHVRLDGPAGVGASLVAHLAGEHEQRRLPHRREVAQAGVHEDDQPDLVVDLVHPVGQTAPGTEIVVGEGATSEVDGEAGRVDGGRAGPPLRHDQVGLAHVELRRRGAEGDGVGCSHPHGSERRRDESRACRSESYRCLSRGPSPWTRAGLRPRRWSGTVRSPDYYTVQVLPPIDVHDRTGSEP